MKVISKKKAIEKRLGGIAVIRLPSGGLTVVLISNKDVLKYHYFGGLQWGYGDYEIVQYVPSKLGKNWYKIELWYLRKYHKSTPSKELKHSAFWMSPTGDLYYCNSHGHDGLATCITASLFGNLEGTRLLENSGWLRAYKSGLLVGKGANLPHINDDQAFVISQLKESGDDDWKYRLSEYLRLYEQGEC